MTKEEKAAFLEELSRYIAAILSNPDLTARINGGRWNPGNFNEFKECITQTCSIASCITLKSRELLNGAELYLQEGGRTDGFEFFPIDEEMAGVTQKPFKDLNPDEELAVKKTALEIIHKKHPNDKIEINDIKLNKENNTVVIRAKVKVNDEDDHANPSIQ
jgi:hypothetical protein